MSHCPKCGAKLKLTDISQFCPNCGVNMRFVNFEENFYREAKQAELSQANMSMKIRNMKAAFVGSKLAIARLAVMLLPIVSLLVPFGSFTLSLPYKAETYQFSALGLYGLFNNGGLNYIFSMTSAFVNGERFSSLRNSLISYAAVAVFGVLILFVSILCFISIRNMQKINVVLSALGAVACVVSVIFIRKFVVTAEYTDNFGELLNGRAGLGFLVCLAAFAAVFIVNLLLSRKGIPVEYDEGTLERVEILKKVRSGELDIDSLPQPIVETEETRKIDEEIAKEEASFKHKHEKESADNGN